MSACPQLSGASVVRDANISSLGYITHRINTKPFLAFAGSERFLTAALANRLVRAVLVTRELADAAANHVGVIVVDDPTRAFYHVHKYLVDHTTLYWEPFENDIDSSARISPHAMIADSNVRIGADVEIEAGTVLHQRSVIGCGSIIRSNCVVSSEGFEFKMFDGRNEFIPHGSGVVIGDGVIAHAGCKFDRGLFGDPTRVGNHSCLDNMVHVAHGVQIGRNCIIAASAVFAAAVVMEDDARIDPNASIAHEVLIGRGAYVTMGSVVTRDVPAGERVTGNFALPHAKFLNNLRRVAK